MGEEQEMRKAGRGTRDVDQGGKARHDKEERCKRNECIGYTSEERSKKQESARGSQERGKVKEEREKRGPECGTRREENGAGER